MMMKRMLSLLLAVLTLTAVLASCGESAGGTETAAADPAAAESTETTAAETELTPDLPELDMEGAVVTFLNNTYVDTDASILAVTEATGDVVNDAVYSRNLAVMSRFNCEFAFLDYYREKSKDAVKSSVLAGDDAFDAISGVQFLMIQLLGDGYFLNLADAPYLDPSMPWWAGDYNTEMSVGNSVYFLSGDITLGQIGRQSCLYLNKQIWEALYGNADGVYETVADGQWTIEVFDNACAGAYSDLNGDGKANRGDCFGCVSDRNSHTDHFTYDAGIRCTERDSDGVPRLTFLNDRTAAFAEWLYGFINNGTYVFIDEADATLIEMFAANETLVMPGYLHQATLFREMEADYALIPSPKYDEAQDTYLSLVHDNGIVFCLPVTCSRADEICAILEAMAYEGYTTVTPAFFEIALKNKYARDSGELPMQILDDIRANPTTDFAYVYNYALNGVALLMRSICKAKSCDFASSYAEVESKAQIQLDELVALYKGLK